MGMLFSIFTLKTLASEAAPSGALPFPDMR